MDIPFGEYAQESNVFLQQAGVSSGNFFFLVSRICFVFSHLGYALYFPILGFASYLTASLFTFFPSRSTPHGGLLNLRV